MGSPRRAQRSGSSGGRRSKGAQRSFCRRQKRSRADFVTTKGRRFAPYKRFCRRRKPWRRANLLRPSILNNRVPIVCVGTQWEAGRRGRVSRYERFLQPEVSFRILQQSRPSGGFAFSCRPAPRGPILGSPRRAQRSGSSGGRRSKGAQRSFCRRQKRSRADFVTTKGRRFAPYKRFRRRRKPWRRANSLRPSILNHPGPHCVHRTQWETGRRGRVSWHEGFLQPEVSFQVLQHSRPLGGCVFSRRPYRLVGNLLSPCRGAYHAPAGG